MQTMILGGIAMALFWVGDITASGKTNNYIGRTKNERENQQSGNRKC